MDADILSAKAGAVYTAVLLSPEHDSTIVILENGGREVDRLTFADQTVLDYGFFSNDTLFWVMTLDTSGTVPTTAISTYRPGRMIVGSITDAQQLMYQVMFQSSQVVCAGTTHLKVYDYTGREDESRRTLIYGWYLAAVEDGVDDPMMAFVPGAQYGAGGEMRDVRMMRANVDEIVRMPFACSTLVAKGDRVYGFSADGHVMVARTGRAEGGRLSAQRARRTGLRRHRRPRGRDGHGQYRLSRHFAVKTRNLLWRRVVQEMAWENSIVRRRSNRHGGSRNKDKESRSYRRKRSIRRMNEQERFLGVIVLGRHRPAGSADLAL